MLRQYALIRWYLWSATDYMAAIEAAEAERQRRIDDFRAALAQLVGVDFEINVTLNGGCLEAQIEDLRFVAYEFIPSDQETHKLLVTLLGRCPTCGTETMSAPIQCVRDLGKMLASFKPNYQHLCRR